MNTNEKVNLRFISYMNSVRHIRKTHQIYSAFFYFRSHNSEEKRFRERIEYLLQSCFGFFPFLQHTRLPSDTGYKKLKVGVPCVVHFFGCLTCNFLYLLFSSSPFNLLWSPGRKISAFHFVHQNRFQIIYLKYNFLFPYWFFIGCNFELKFLEFKSRNLLKKTGNCLSFAHLAHKLRDALIIVCRWPMSDSQQVLATIALF